MDEFFAAVEKLDRPDLRGKPLLIGGLASQRGVVATASYEARAFGCHSAMAMAKAVRLCPQAIVLPPRFERYKEISGQVFAIFEQFTPVIEPLSIDEAFLDMTGCERLLADLGSPRGIGAEIKRRIRQQVGITASVGAAPNKFLAKIASDLQKPDGLVVIEPADIHKTLDPLDIQKLWGVGPKTAKQFHRLGVKTVGQLRHTPVETLRLALGQWAQHYLDLANGLDDRPVTTDAQAKSIGQEETFAANVGDLDELRRVLLTQVQEVACRLRRHKLRAATVTLKLRYGDFTTITRSITLGQATDDTNGLWDAARGILETWASSSLWPLRLLGVTTSHFKQGGQQLALFDQQSSQKSRQLDTALDDINRRFGKGTLRRG